jgi:hypothetical protein
MFAPTRAQNFRKRAAERKHSLSGYWYFTGCADAAEGRHEPPRFAHQHQWYRQGHEDESATS